MARDLDMDLVEVNSQSSPPVCKIMDYGKLKYDHNKKMRHNKSAPPLKEVQLRPVTESHDLETKVRSIVKFLQGKSKVQIKVKFKQRELRHKELGFKVIEEIIEQVEEYGAPVSAPSMNGRQLTCTLSPNK